VALASSCSAIVSVTGDGDILIRLGGRTARCTAGGRADWSDGRVDGSDRAGVWVTSGPVRRSGSARFVFILYY